MAIKPSQLINGAQNIDIIEKEIDRLLLETGKNDDSVVVISTPTGFDYDSHFNQLRALYIHVGWSDVVYSRSTSKLKFHKYEIS